MDTPMIQDGNWLISVSHIVAARRHPDEDGQTQELELYLDHPQLKAMRYHGPDADAIWHWLRHTHGLTTEWMRNCTPRPDVAGLDPGPGTEDTWPTLLEDPWPATLWTTFLRGWTRYQRIIDRTRLQIMDHDPHEQTFELAFPDGQKRWRDRPGTSEVLARYDDIAETLPGYADPPDDDRPTVHVVVEPAPEV